MTLFLLCETMNVLRISINSRHHIIDLLAFHFCLSPSNHETLGSQSVFYRTPHLQIFPSHPLTCSRPPSSALGVSLGFLLPPWQWELIDRQLDMMTNRHLKLWHTTVLPDLTQKLAFALVFLSPWSSNIQFIKFILSFLFHCISNKKKYVVIL